MGDGTGVLDAIRVLEVFVPYLIAN